MGSLNNLCFDASVSHASCASLKLQMLVRGVLERNQIMIGLRQVLISAYNLFMAY